MHFTTFSERKKKQTNYRQLHGPLIDMEKAIDRLEVDFMKKCFFNLGFGDKWVD